MLLGRGRAWRSGRLESRSVHYQLAYFHSVGIRLVESGLETLGLRRGFSPA